MEEQYRTKEMKQKEAEETRKKLLEGIRKLEEEEKKKRIEKEEAEKKRKEAEAERKRKEEKEKKDRELFEKIDKKLKEAENAIKDIERIIEYNELYLRENNYKDFQFQFWNLYNAYLSALNAYKLNDIDGGNKLFNEFNEKLNSIKERIKFLRILDDMKNIDNDVEMKNKNKKDE